MPSLRTFRRLWALLLSLPAMTRLPGGWGLGEGRDAFLREEVSTPLSLSVRSLLPHQVKIGGFLLELSLSMPDSHFQGGLHSTQARGYS